MSAGVRVGRPRGPFVASLVGLVVAGLFAAQPALASVPVITDFAGTGTAGAPTPGSATGSDLSGPKGLTVDSSGNLYIADTNNNQVEKVTPGGTLSIIAGTGLAGAPSAGRATSSHLWGPQGVAVDSSGNIYIADTNNSQVEKVTPGGTLSIIAGTGISGAATAGPAISSRLSTPQGVGVDSSGDIYIADTNNKRVDKITPDGTLAIFAGTGAYSGPIAGPAVNSPLDYPDSVVLDPSGNVYITNDDDADGNGVVVKVTPDGMLSIFAGTGGSGATTNGPATSADLYGPQGLFADPAGNVYIADNRQIEQVAPNGTLTVRAGDGTFGAPTYGAVATSSPLNSPTGVAVTGKTVFIADSVNNTIDRVGLATPGAPGQPQLTAGDTTAQLSFTPPVDPGTSIVTGYQVSLDGGASWQTISTTPGPNGTLMATLSGLTDGTTYGVSVRAVNSSGSGDPSASGSVTPRSLASQNTNPPAISGHVAVGYPLTCSAGSWTGAERFTYQWQRDGEAIPNVTGQAYTLTTADQGHTLTCTVIAYSSTGAIDRATSSGILIPIATVARCPKATGTLSVTRLGPVWFGMSRFNAHRLLPRFEVYNAYTDNFCLAGGWGIRVGYATQRILHGLPGHPHAAGIVLALTANRSYSLDGVRPGSSLRTAAARFTLGRPIRHGPNHWYVISSHTTSWVLKVRGRTVQEIGIARRSVTSTRADQNRLLASF